MLLWHAGADEPHTAQPCCYGILVLQTPTLHCPVDLSGNALTFSVRSIQGPKVPDAGRGCKAHGGHPVAHAQKDRLQQGPTRDSARLRLAEQG